MAGSLQCAGALSIRTCNANGVGYAAEVPCPTGQGCNATANACRAFTCMPTMGVSCSGIAARNVCDANGLGTTVAACAMNESCRDGTCRTRICAPGTNRCVTGNPAQVENCNADGLGVTATTCPMGQSCSSGTCVPQSCTAGSTQCVGPTSIRTCNADGLAYASPGDCPSGQGCNATANACRAFTCTPGSALVCYASSGRTVCNADGQATSAIPCGATESCRDGVCRTRICSPGALRCSSGSVNQVETCDTNGLGWTATTCPTGQSCSSGTCVRQVCTPGTPSCAVGGVATRNCSPDGLGYGPTTTCSVGASCDVATGMCANWICTPGSATCVGNSRRVCNADGRGYSTTNCGSRQTCSAGICVDWTCTPGEYSCADINTRRVCNADGFGYSAAACPTMNACLGVGVCTPWTCTPGSAGPVCGSTTSRQVCNADGQGYATVACAAGQGCSAGVCAVRCGDGIVGSGETCDDGNTVSGDGCSGTCQVEITVLLSRGRPATQFPEYMAQFPASNSVDGNRNSFSHTTATIGAWLTIDLQSTRPISRVDVYNRIDCCQDQLRNFDILVSTNGTTWIPYAYEPSTASMPSRYSISTSARYVRIQQRSALNIHPGEVEIYGL